MKILQINSYHHRRGGADVVYLNTGELLATQNNEVMYFSSEHSNNLENKFSKYFIPFQAVRDQSLSDKIINAKNYIYNKAAYKNLNRLLNTQKPDIAHIHLFYGSLTSSILKSLKENGIPIILTVHDYRLLCPANAFLDSNHNICEKCKNGSYYQCLTNKCRDNNISYSAILMLEAYTRKYLYTPLNYVDHFIFVSKFSRKKHIEFDFRYENKSSHLYNFTPDVKGYVSNKNENYFLFFGRLSIEKGIKTLLAATIKTNCKLKIAGIGPLEEDVKRHCELNSNLQYVGFKKENDLLELIEKASFIIVSSECYENNPMTIIEAYTLGKPVIGANIGGIPEIIVENETGFLFESRNIDDLAAVMTKAQQIGIEAYKKMSKAAKLFGDENFSPKNHYSRLIQIYSQIMKEKRNA